MVRTGRSIRALFSLLLALLLNGPQLAPSVVKAVDDTTPPTGGVELYDVDGRAHIIDILVTFADAESGIDHLAVQCDANEPAPYAFATHIFVPALDPTAGGCTNYGTHTYWVTAYNGAGLQATAAVTYRSIPAVTLEISEPVTGKPFTITPTMPADYTLPADARCMWEFRYGDDKSLFENEFDDTFGYVGFKGPASEGYCGPWTFTLPYSRVPHYQIIFKVSHTGDNPIGGDSWGFEDDGRGVIKATVGTTEREITKSNLRLLTILPDTFEMTVAKPVTYRVHAIGNYSPHSDDQWVAAWQTSGEHAFTQSGGSSFTFTPDRAGVWSVWWNVGPSRSDWFAAAYDPKARYPDGTAPNTTSPIQTIPHGEIDATTTPIKLSWHGSDVGWGIDHYALERTVDGGTWGHRIRTSHRSVTEDLAGGHRYRFRVRAVDKAGHVGSWDEGPSFRVKRHQESSDLLHWHGTWTTEDGLDDSGGHSAYADTGGASVRYTFTGRSIGWVSARGPSSGKAAVYVNGNRVATIDLESASIRNARVVWSKTWSKKATRTVKVVCLGTTGHARVDVDAFIVVA